MEHFFHRLHVRRESIKKANMTRKEQWRDDEHQVRHGSCDFPFKYLGYTELSESKGSQICGQSFNKLKSDNARYSLAQIFQRNRHRQSLTSQHYAMLHVSANEVRIADENEDILVDTPISWISFCCPNSQHERGFTYICRAEVPWKWHCHAMEAVDDHGERLNHAVGCAFSICLEKKLLAKRRERDWRIENQPSAGLPSGGSSQLTSTDGQTDPQDTIITEVLSHRGSDCLVLSSVDRPRGPPEFKDRKGPLGGLMQAHPYKYSSMERAMDGEPVEEEAMELRFFNDHAKP